MSKIQNIALRFAQALRLCVKTPTEIIQNLAFKSKMATPSSEKTPQMKRVRPDSARSNRCPVVPIIAIEAIIGAGKSTLLTAIQERFGDEVIVVQEPVGVWTDVDGHNLLSEYYKDQKRWSFSFQTFAIFSRLAAVREALASVRP